MTSCDLPEGLPLHEPGEGGAGDGGPGLVVKHSERRRVDNPDFLFIMVAILASHYFSKTSPQLQGRPNVHLYIMKLS